MSDQNVPPADITSDDKIWAALAYIFSPVVPVIILLMEDKKNRPFIKAHNMQALMLGIVLWVINVALIVHSDEALLAAGFIFTFHFFNVHFRIEKFPMDPVIFSGRMSKTEMLHERKRWYDRLLATNQLDKVRVKDEWAQWKRVMHPVGFLAFGIGVVLLILIFVAMTARLFLGH